MTTEAASGSVLERLDGMLDDLEGLYKDVHSHPELSMQEERTAGIAAHRLGWRDARLRPRRPRDLAGRRRGALRMAGLRYDLNLPSATDLPQRVDPRRVRKGERRTRRRSDDERESSRPQA